MSKNKLAIFSPEPRHILEHQGAWPRILQQALSQLYGSEIDFKYHHFENKSQHKLIFDTVLPELKSNTEWYRDSTAVILWPNPYFWYFHDGEIIGLEHRESLDSFDRLINRPLIYELYRDYYLSFLDDLAAVLGIQIQVVPFTNLGNPTFPRHTWIKLADGSIEEISNNEFKDRFELKHHRYSGMCLRNHRIFADRLTDAIFKKAILDLKNGFHKRFLSLEKIEDRDFCLKEFAPKEKTRSWISTVFG